MLDQSDGTAGALSFDLTSARTMLAALAAPYLDAGEDGQFEIVGFDVNRKRGAVSPRHFPIEQTEAMVAHAAAINHAEGVGAYVGAGLRRAAPEAGRARKEHVAGTRWLWLDFDDEGAAERGLDWLRRKGLPPTHLVTTGTMPWLRAQAWFRLDRLADGDNAERLMHGLIARTGADPSPKDRNRVMRLAGSVNWPKPDKPGRIAELVRWR